LRPIDIVFPPLGIPSAEGNVRVLALFALFALLSACAFTEDTPEIKYVPNSASPLAQAQPVGITVIDGRTADRNRISTKINGYGMEGGRSGRRTISWTSFAKRLERNLNSAVSLSMPVGGRSG